MTAYSQPRSVSLPGLSADWVRRWVQKTQDLVLLLDDQDRIAGVLQDGRFAPDDIQHWLGLTLLEVVSADTRPKVPLLLANDAASDQADDRWRHINLLASDGAMLPVLMRYMQLTHVEPSMRTVICRDLRATADLSQRHQWAHREFDQTMLTLRDTLRQKEQEIERLRLQSDPVERMVDQIKRIGFDQVIGQATRLLQRQCLQALLDQAQGDPRRAARSAGVDDATWSDLIRAAGL
jgi:hypothetical protein